MIGSDYDSVIEPVIEHVSGDPGRLAMVIIANDGAEEMVTTGRLHANASAYAREMQGTGVGPGDIVIIALDHSLELVSAFWGTLYIGAVPSVLMYPVPGVEPKNYVKQVRDAVVNSQARAVITVSPYDAELAKLLHDLDCRVLNTDRISSDRVDRDILFPGGHTSGEQFAYLQYTSGTTGMQKGVLLAHRAILNFISSFSDFNEIGTGDVVVSWMPMYHDFGLFAGLVLPMVIGINSVIMSPFKWIRNPVILLRAIHKHHGTCCWMPNFGFAHLAGNARERDLEGLDLRRLRLLINGAEPVINDHQQLFVKRFQPYGISEEALSPGYGMAENTLGVSVTPPGECAPVDWVSVKTLQEDRYASPAHPHASGSTPVVSCGVALPGVEILIVDDRGQPIAERNVGEIIVRSNFLFSGYHLRADLYNQAMRNGWLHTGDLGYMVNEHLYVCGRKKDLIIVGGRNIHPEDIETVANTVPGIAPGRAVAFGVMDEDLGSESVILVCDLKGHFNASEKQQLERELRRGIFQALSVTLTEVHLVEKGWVIKTSSGKISRTANRDKYMTTLKRSS